MVTSLLINELRVILRRPVVYSRRKCTLNLTRMFVNVQTKVITLFYKLFHQTQIIVRGKEIQSQSRESIEVHSAMHLERFQDFGISTLRYLDAKYYRHERAV